MVPVKSSGRRPLCLPVCSWILPSQQARRPVATPKGHRFLGFHTVWSASGAFREQSPLRPFVLRTKVNRMIFWLACVSRHFGGIAFLTLAAFYATELSAASASPAASEMAGLIGPVGARPDARKVRTLRIDKPG